MTSRTCLFPRDLSEPETLKDHQILGLKKVLDGFRNLYQTLDDVLPTGEAKDAALLQLIHVKRASDEVVRSHQPRLTFKRMAELFTPIETMDRRVAKVVVNVLALSDIRTEPSLKDCLDLGSSREKALRGLVGHLMVAEVYVNKKVPVGQIAVIADDENVEVGPDWIPSSLETI